MRRPHDLHERGVDVVAQVRIVRGGADDGPIRLRARDCPGADADGHRNAVVCPERAELAYDIALDAALAGCRLHAVTIEVGNGLVTRDIDPQTPLSARSRMPLPSVNSQPVIGWHRSCGGFFS
jgi:hypothetical protein